MNRKLNVVLILVILLVLVAVACFMSVLLHLDIKIAEKSYPIKYGEQVSTFSAEFGVPEHIVYGVIFVESNFRADVVSRSGAVGLMQIMPATFADLQKRLGESYSESALSDPSVNIRYGCYYLSYLYNIFGDWETVFAAYNGGMGNVKKWLKDERYSADGHLVNIPFKETASYVKKVEVASEKYKEIINKTKEK